VVSLILLDSRMPGMSGDETIRMDAERIRDRCRELDERMRSIFASGSGA